MGRKRTGQPRGVRNSVAGKFGKRLEQLATEAGLSTAELAERAGVTEDAIRKYFRVLTRIRGEIPARVDRIACDAGRFLPFRVAGSSPANSLQLSWDAGRAMFASRPDRWGRTQDQHRASGIAAPGPQRAGRLSTRFGPRDPGQIVARFELPQPRIDARCSGKPRQHRARICKD